MLAVVPRNHVEALEIVELHCTDDGVWETKMGPNSDPSTDMLVPVFKDGSLLTDYTFAEIRERAWPK